MWGPQINHISAAQALSGTYLVRTKEDCHTRILAPHQTKGGCVTERKQSARDIFAKSLVLIPPAKGGCSGVLEPSGHRR